MKRFLASGWFPFLTSLLLAGAVAGSYVYLKPDPALIGQYQIERIAKIAAWGIGPVTGLLTLIIAGILNLVRRIVRLRRVAVLHPAVVLAATLPWVVFAWQITGEKPYTPVARALIEFAGRPLLLGSLLTCALVLLISIPLFLPARKS